MSTDFNFEQLVDLFQRTHEETRQSAARAIDQSLVVRNWLFGWYIVEYEQHGADRAEYGRQLLVRIASHLRKEGMKGVSGANLKLYRRFYQRYKAIGQTPSDQFQPISGDPAVLGANSRNPQASTGRVPQPISVEAERPQEIGQTLSVQSLAPGLIGAGVAASAIVQTLSEELAKRFALGWSHYVALLSIDDAEARNFYEIEAAENGWSVRELRRQVDSSLYQRLALSRDRQEVRRLACKGQMVEKPSDLIKNPYVLEFLGLDERPAYSESDMEAAIINRLEQFLLELGKGFLFEARQKRFSFDDSHFFVDLVFYNRLLRCYVLIDLKLGKVSHQDLGQMQMYVNYFDRHVKTEEELPTVGILLCDDKNDAVVELTLPKDANIYASKYQLYLPSKHELAAQLEDVRREFEQAEYGNHE